MTVDLAAMSGCREQTMRSISAPQEEACVVAGLLYEEVAEAAMLTRQPCEQGSKGPSCFQ